jgi:hypothetical protein
MVKGCCARLILMSVVLLMLNSMIIVHQPFAQNALLCPTSLDVDLVEIHSPGRRSSIGMLRVTP